MAENGALAGRRAIVTGGAQGLGEAISERLAAEGGSVAICDIQGDACEELSTRLATTYGVDTVGASVDVTREDQVAGFFDRVAEGFGGLDLLVANAGVLRAHAIEEFPVDDWRLTMEVNLTGYMLAAKHAARHMIPSARGAIVQINSKSGKKGSFRNSAYAASKFGGIGLTQSIALELAPHGIRVNSVCPGNLLDSPLWVNSLYEQYSKRLGISPEEVRKKYEDQVPLGRGCSYDDVTNVVVFLASDQASYMTGQAINVTGGQEMR
ncbi:MAG: sorbitol-6-phosphate dehydrogenase [Armatimonadia bacterium]|nr:sorbitol-6-phosphate dehydrogenase [Armatimonadia bacterium]